MKRGWTKKWLCLACVGLPLVLSTGGIGQTAVGADQSGTGSVLERVQRENDPELSELIRIALTNRKDVGEQERLEVMRKVTQCYAQIRLLDQQIEQVAQKIKATAAPAEMQSELVLAKAELEAKRATELANLRELMGVVPRFPFESQPIPTLNTWLSVLPVDERALVLDALKPFEDYWALERHKVAGLLSEKETLDYIRRRLQAGDGLPIRIDIYTKPETNSMCLRLRDAIRLLAQGAGAEMQAEVSLKPITWVGTGTSTFYVREGRIRTLYPAAVRRPDGGGKLLTSGLVAPDEIEQSILWRVTMPKNVPLTFRIEYGETSAPLARQVADTARAVAQRLGIADLVEVVGVLVEPVPETAFLGRWEALGKGCVRAIDIQTQGICEIVMGEGSRAIQAGTSVKGTWLPLMKEVLADVNDKTANQPHYHYLASLNEKGNLVVDRVEVYPQGSIDVTGVGRAILKKVQ
jgi:hypothetical protein